MKWFSKTKLFHDAITEILKQEESGTVEVTTITGETFLLHEPLLFGSDFVVCNASSGAPTRLLTLPFSSICHILHDQPLEAGPGPK